MNYIRKHDLAIKIYGTNTATTQLINYFAIAI